MTTVPLILCLLAPTQPVDKYTITLFQDSFVVRSGDWKQSVPVKTPPTREPLSVVFRKNKTFAVWDDRGLSIRVGEDLVSNKLADVAVSPRIFRRQEILDNLRLMHQGQRTKTATALSGSRRIGTQAYFLARWDDKNGKPWLEALVQVDLAAAKPKPRLVGRFDGISTATKPIDDQLFLDHGQLAVVTRRAESWGVATFAAADRQFDFREFGQDLVSWYPSGAFIERTAYGTVIGGRLELASLTRTTLFETPVAANFVEDSGLAYAVIGHTILRNLATGADHPIPAGAAVRQVGSLVAVWAPADRPKNAWLYDPARWDERARWRTGP